MGQPSPKLDLYLARTGWRPPSTRLSYPTTPLLFQLCLFLNSDNFERAAPRLGFWSVRAAGIPLEWRSGGRMRYTVAYYAFWYFSTFWFWSFLDSLLDFFTLLLSRVTFAAVVLYFFFILFWLMPGMGCLGWGEHGTVGTGYINPWLTEEPLSGNETIH